MSNSPLYQVSWKEFQIRSILPSDYASVVAHLKDNFYEDEAVSQFVGDIKERMPDQERRLIDMISGNDKSLLAVHKDYPEKIAAVLLVKVHSLDGPKKLKYTPVSPATLTYLNLLEEIGSSYNVFEGYGVTSFPELAILSTDKSFRGYGLATELYRQGISLLFSEGVDKTPLIYSEFSSPYSRKVGERLGFKEKGRYYLKSFKDGNPHLKNLNLDDEDAFVTLTVLERSL